jgi:hypothetical protein
MLENVDVHEGAQLETPTENERLEEATMEEDIGYADKRFNLKPYRK